MRISFELLDKNLKENEYLARRFFQLLCVILSNRFIAESIGSSGWGDVVRDVPLCVNEEISSASSISLLNRLKVSHDEIIVHHFLCSLKNVFIYFF